MTFLDVAFSKNREGVGEALPLPLLFPVGKGGVGAGEIVEVAAGSLSEAMIAWMVSRTSTAYSLPRRVSSSAFKEDWSGSNFGSPQVLGGVLDYSKGQSLNNDSTWKIHTCSSSLEAV